jgi:5'-nucleotidase
MKPITILVDMDDTIENLLDSWIACLNERHSLTVQLSDITDWDMTKFFPQITEHELYEPLFEPEFWDTVKPRKDAIEYLGRLQDEGCNIYIVTSSHYKTIEAKMERVLFKHFPFIKWNHVITADFKQMIKGDVMIDDAQHNLIGGEYERILMDAPHNQNFKNNLFGIKRANCWKCIYDIIHERFQ